MAAKLIFSVFLEENSEAMPCARKEAIGLWRQRMSSKAYPPPPLLTLRIGASHLFPHLYHQPNFSYLTRRLLSSLYQLTDVKVLLKL